MADARTTGFSSSVDLEKLFQEAEQTVNRIIHSKKDHKDEKSKSAPPAEPVSPREIELKLAQAQEDLEEQQRRYQQLEQEFQNFRERTERQSKFAVLRGNSELLKELLEILDTFDFARNTFDFRQVRPHGRELPEGLRPALPAARPPCWIRSA